MTDYTINDLLEKYLNGDLEEDQKLELEERLKSSKELQNQLEMIRLANDFVTLQGLHDMENKIRNWKPKNGGTGKGGKILMISLIMIVAGIFVYHLTKNLSAEQAAAPEQNYIPKNETGIVVEGDTGNINLDSASKIITENHKEKRRKRREKGYAADGVKLYKPPMVINDISPRNDLKIADTIETKKKSNNPDKPSVVADACNKVNIKVNLSSRETCENRREGEVLIQNITGGTAPYFVSINKGEFTRQTIFTNLEAGEYSIKIRDANHCVSGIEFIEVENKRCQEKEYAFSPSSGQKFVYPLGEATSGNIEIYNSAGALVFQKSIIAGDNWDGTNSQGTILPTDSYFYKMTVQDKVITGYVTIVE